MAKTNTPFLSLESQGSVGKSITSQKRGRDTVLRQLPVPTDPYSLPQAYQRWLYQDYAYLWTQQSLASKQLYATAGSRYHLTGFQYWMRVMLRTLPDLLGYWRLDRVIGGLSPDQSPFNLHGLVIGASGASGVISDCLYFDGINDRFSIPDSPNWHFGTSNFTISLSINVAPASRVLFSQSNNDDNNFIIFENRLLNLARPGLLIRVAGVNTLQFRLDNDWPHDTWFHFALVREGNLASDWHAYVDGVDQPKTLEAGSYAASIPNYTFPLFFCCRLVAGGYWEFLDGYLDQIQIRNRAISQQQALKHSQRSY